MSGSAFRSFNGLKNTDEQLANAPGIRRFGIVATADLSPSLLDWPRTSGPVLDINLETMEVLRPLPLLPGRTVSIIQPADNSAFLTIEVQGERFYQSYKYTIGFDLAGLTKAQAAEVTKLLNTGCILFAEDFDGEIRVVGSRYTPLMLKSKGDSGKKGGDKRGYSFSAENDSYTCEPPFYPDTMILPGMLSYPAGFTYGFSLAFNS